MGSRACKLFDPTVAKILLAALVQKRRQNVKSADFF